MIEETFDGIKMPYIDNGLSDISHISGSQSCSYYTTVGLFLDYMYYLLSLQ